ncbi:MAG: hypothetical protein AAF654_01080 [Myxococcota bacterium]
MSRPIFLLAVFTACSSPAIELTGRPCGANEECGAGFVCNPLSQLCGRAVEVNCDGGTCPEEISSTSPCGDVEAFLPCVSGVSDCSLGCRTCQADGTWSACSDPANENPGAAEICGDDEDNDGDGLVDEEDAVGCTVFFEDVDGDDRGSSTNSRCLCVPSGQFRASIDGDCDDGDPRVWDSCGACVDTDNDDFFVGCDSYVGTAGEDCADRNPTLGSDCADCLDVDADGAITDCGDSVFWDCDDTDPNAWVSCASCVDNDLDGAFVGCDAYVTVGQDCSDSDPNNTVSCASCVDSDTDGRFAGCDSYVNREFDCDDLNTDVWSTCGTCVDTDADGAFVGCDRYTVLTQDCDDVANPNEFINCGSCVDNDGDGAFVGCDQFVTVDEDCDDDPRSCGALCAPGAVEWCNATDNDCGGDGSADCSRMVEPENLGSIDVCASDVDFVLTSDFALNTGTGIGTLFDGGGGTVVDYPDQRLVVQGSSAPGIRVLFFRSLTISSGVRFSASGSAALALVACDEIRIDGVLDVSATLHVGGPGGFDGDRIDAVTSNFGPGGGTRGGVDPIDPFSGGGGGAGHCGVGGAGGDAVYQVPDPDTRIFGGVGGATYGGVSPLLGGSGGASGGPFNPGVRYGGGGGGAVQLVAGHRVLLSGIIAANGAGGRLPAVSPLPSSSGGGGGSGGTVVVDAPLVVTAGGSWIVANGGGGGAGQRDSFIRDVNGEDGGFTDDPAEGGEGPNGDFEDGNAGDGNSGSNPNGGNAEQDDFFELSGIRGGGGGGAGGVIQVNASYSVLDGGLSPNIVDDCPSCCTREGAVGFRPF